MNSFREDGEVEGVQGGRWTRWFWWGVRENERRVGMSRSWRIRWRSLAGREETEGVVVEGVIVEGGRVVETEEGGVVETKMLRIRE